MRILIVHRYFWPDTPAYASMLHTMARHFSEQGHQVTVFSTQPCYNGVYLDSPLPKYEVSDGVEVYRTPLLRESKSTPIRRAINVAVFCLSLTRHCLLRRHKYQLMTVATFPPVVMGMTARLIGMFSRIRYLYHCQDLYPETAIASGVAKAGWLTRLASHIDAANNRRAEAVVVLSDDMRNTLAQRGVATDNVTVINNFILDSFDNTVAIDPAYVRSDGVFRVIFAGNLGRFQNLDTLVDAAKLLSDKPEIELLFVGSGSMLKPLKNLAGELLERTISFRPPLPVQQVMRVISDAQLAVISLAPGVIDSAYPSKTMTNLEAGCRLLVVVEPEAELSRMVVSENIGTIVSAQTPAAIAAAVRVEFDAWNHENAEDSHIRSVGRRHFGQKAILAKWTELLVQLEQSSFGASNQPR